MTGGVALRSSTIRQMAGLCECGCGQETNLASYTDRTKGWINGQPKRFVHGHNGRKAFADFGVGDGLCGCGCGQKTVVAQSTNARYGYVKGKPIRFLHGHHGRKRERYRVEDRGYDTPCWVWQLYLDRDGYAKEGTLRACRIYYERHLGPIPADLQLDHLCRVRACVNPAHLEPVTGAVNQRRGANAKLTVGDVRAIRGSTERNAIVAKRYGIHPSTVSQIRSGLRWKGVI